MTRLIHRILLLLALLIGGAGMSYVEAAKVTLTVQASPSSYGQVRIGTNAWSSSTQLQTATGAKPTISAQANSGYRFTKWNDNNTNASRQITIGNSNVTYTAYFEPNTVTLTVTSNNTNYGTVTGGGTYSYGTSVTIKATPKTGYHFVQWSDGNKNASRTVTATANATYTATFAINQYTLTVSSNNTNYGTVTGGGTYNHGATANLKATPKTGYHFVKWNDNNTNASRSVTVTAAATYTATFAINTYTLTVKTATNNTTQGTVKINSGTAGASASATINHGTNATITATPATGYHFVKWNDNNTNASRSVTVTAAATYTATFAINTYTLQVKTATNNTTQGTVKINSGTAGATASATINHGSSATITATPATGYHFVKWNDNNTNASRSVTITAAATYTATFAINTYTLTVNSNNTSMGTVTGGGTYNHGATATLTATPKGCYRFKQWNDGVTSSSRTVTVTQAKTYTATFEETTYSGNCGANGNNVTWSLNICTGVLTLSGSGAMSNWDYNSGNYCPWYSYKDEVKTVVIENGITNIGAAAFDRHFELTSITIPNSVTMIDGGAFYSCSKLTSITLPSTLTTIGNGSCCGFAYTQLTSITIPSNVTSIGQWSFCDISTLTDIYVSWTTANAIPTWWNMTNKSGIKLHVPCGTKSLYQAAAGWKNYTIVDDIASGTCGTNVTWYLSCDGVMTISGTGEMTNFSSVSMPWYALQNDIKSVVINPGVTSIGNYAFYNCINLTSVSIPSSVTTIKPSAFQRCSSLSSVTIPSGVTTINYYAFRNCTSLTSVTIPSSVTSLGDETFYNTGLTDVYVSWTTAEAIPQWYSMAETNQAKNITLHVPCGTAEYYLAKAGWNNCNIRGGCNTTYTLTVASDNTAYGLVQIDKGTPAASITEQVYTDDSHRIIAVPVDACHQFVQWNDGNTENPRTVMPNTNTTYTATFTEHQSSGICGTNLTWVLECDSTLRISGTGAMTNLSSGSQPWYSIAKLIKHVVIEEGVTSIGNNAFYGMNIVTVTNPSTLKTIGATAFYRCHQLESINFPNGMTSIGNSVTGHGPFYECTSLKAIYIPASLTFINSDTFLRCYSLTSIVVDPANPKYDSRDNCNAIIETAINKLWYGCQTTVIPDGVKTVAQFAFEYQHNLKSIRISNTVTHFETGVFKECENLKDIYVEWTSNPPQDILTSWYEHSNLDATITIHVPCGHESLYSSSTAWNRYQIADDHLKGGMCGAQGSNQTWMLSCDGHLDIKGIGAMADYSAGGAPWNEHKDAIHTVTFANGINTVGENAFAGFTNLTHIYSPWTENIPVLPASNNPQPSVTLHVPCSAISAYQSAGWGNYTIAPEYTASGTCGADGDNLTWTLCDSTLTISGTGAMADFVADADCPWYHYRTQIYTINIDEGVTTIGAKAFVFSRISSITIPNSVTSIGRYAFCYSNYLEEIVLPEGLISIGDHAFYYGNVLKTVHIPSSVTSLGVSAFEGCSLLKDIYVEWQSSIPEWPTKFSKQNGVNLHVPCGTEALYQDAANWKNYTMVGDEVFTITVTTDDASMGMVQLGTAAEQASFTEQFNCGEEITITAIPANGYAFDQWSDNSYQASRTITLTSDTTLTALFKQSVYPVDGALPGVFSVSDTKKVVFSQGNLQFNAALGTHQRTNGTTANGTWRFAENQYDFVGDNTQGNVYYNDEKCSNERVSNSYNGWIDYFNHGNTGYSDKSPTSYTTAFGMNFNSPSVYDWGSYVAISNGGNMPGYYIVNGWIVLQRFQWNYLFNSRANAQDLRSLATVNDVLGCILLPDDWQLPSGIVFTPDESSYATNTYTGEQWNRMEQAGAVFLPAAGRRAYDSNGSPQLSYPEIQTTGYVWSSSGIGNQGVAVAMSFGIDNFALKTFLQGGANKKYDGISVRLVHYVSSYHIIFRGYKDGEENVVLQDKLVAEGAMPIPPEVPEDDCRTFIGWDRVIEPASGNTEYIAQYELKGPYTITVTTDDASMGDVSITVNP